MGISPYTYLGLIHNISNAILGARYLAIRFLQLSENFIAFSGFSINLVLVKKNIATRTFRLSDKHATQTHREYFLENRHTYS